MTVLFWPQLPSPAKLLEQENDRLNPPIKISNVELFVGGMRRLLDFVLWLGAGHNSVVREVFQSEFPRSRHPERSASHTFSRDIVLGARSRRTPAMLTLSNAVRRFSTT